MSLSINNLYNTVQGFFRSTPEQSVSQNIRQYINAWSNRLLQNLPGGLRGKIVIHNTITNDNSKFRGFYENAANISEGQGYGMWIMLGANNEREFSQLWQAQFETLGMNEQGLIPWARHLRGACLPITSFDGISGENSAIDADFDILAAGITAYHRYQSGIWQGRKTAEELRVMRDQLINLAKNLFEEGVEPLEIIEGGRSRNFYVLKSTDGAGRRGNVVKFYTSYAAPAWYKMAADFLREVGRETRGFQGVQITDYHKGRRAVSLVGLDQRFDQLRNDTLTLMEQIAGNQNLRNEGRFPSICNVVYYPHERRYSIARQETDRAFDSAESVRIPWRLGVDARWFGNQRSLNLLNAINPILSSYAVTDDIGRTAAQFVDYARGNNVTVGNLSISNTDSYYKATVPLMYTLFLNNSVLPDAVSLPTYDVQNGSFQLEFNQDVLGQIPVYSARNHYERNFSATDPEIAKNYILGIKTLLNVSLIETVINSVRGFFGLTDQNDFAEAQRYSERVVQEADSRSLYYALPFMTDIMKDMGISGRHVSRALEFARTVRASNRTLSAEEESALTLIDLALANINYSLDRRYVTRTLDMLKSRTELPPLLECALIKGYILERRYSDAQQLINTINQRNLNLQQVYRNIESGNYTQAQNILSEIISNKQDLLAVSALKLDGNSVAADELLARANSAGRRDLQRISEMLRNGRHNEARQALRSILSVNQQPLITANLNHLGRMIRFRTTNVQNLAQASEMIADGSNYLQNILDNENRYTYMAKADTALLPIVNVNTPLLMRDNYIEGLNLYLDFIENSSKSLVIRDNNLDNMRTQIWTLRNARQYNLADATTLLLPGTGTLIQRTLQRIQTQAETYSKIFAQQMDVRTLFMELLVFKAENNSDSDLVRAEQMRQQIDDHINTYLLNNITVYGDVEIENAYISPLKVMLNMGFSNLQNRTVEQELRYQATREVRQRHNLAADANMQAYQQEINTLVAERRRTLGNDPDETIRNNYRQQIISLLMTYPQVANLIETNNLLGGSGQVNKEQFLARTGATEEDWQRLVSNGFLNSQGQVQSKFVNDQQLMLSELANSGISNERSTLQQIFRPVSKLFNSFPRVRNWLGLSTKAERVFDFLAQTVQQNRQNYRAGLDQIGQSIFNGVQTIYSDQQNGQYGYFFNADRYLPFIAESAVNLYWSGDDQLKELAIGLLRAAMQDRQSSSNISFQLQYWKIMADYLTDRSQLQQAYEEVKRLEPEIIRLKGPNSSEYLNWLVVMGNIIFNSGMMQERFSLRGKMETFIRNNQQVLNILDDDLPERIQLYKIFGDIVNEENPRMARELYYARADELAGKLDNLHLLSGPMRAWIYLQLYKSTRNPAYRQRIDRMRRTWIHDSRFRRYYNEAFM